jgi:predicted RNA binding protein YcfA (HicA-like mRNA interferase family)
MKVSDVLRLLHDDGWFSRRDSWQSQAVQASCKAGRVTVAGKLSDDLAPGTLNSILKQAGLKK